MATFAREVRVLKHVHHCHCVDIVASYTLDSTQIEPNVDAVAGGSLRVNISFSIKL